MCRPSFRTLCSRQLIEREAAEHLQQPVVPGVLLLALAGGVTLADLTEAVEPPTMRP